MVGGHLWAPTAAPPARAPAAARPPGAASCVPWPPPASASSGSAATPPGPPSCTPPPGFCMAVQYPSATSLCAAASTSGPHAHALHQAVICILALRQLLSICGCLRASAAEPLSCMIAHLLGQGPSGSVSAGCPGTLLGPACLLRTSPAFSWPSRAMVVALAVRPDWPATCWPMSCKRYVTILLEPSARESYLARGL